MKSSRRRFLGTTGGAIGAAVTVDLAAAHETAADPGPPAVSARTYDVAVIGAGVFGTWTAWHLQKAGSRVALIDAYGPASSRASSGGESRVTRMGYGDKEVYTRWSWRSLVEWKALSRRAGGAPLFHEVGVLWMSRDRDPLSLATLATLARVGVPHERLERAELERRWPHVAFGPLTWATYEPASGVLMARRAVQAVAAEVKAGGGELVTAQAAAPTGRGRASEIALADGSRVRAGSFVFALGPWLGKVFPDLLGQRIFTTRQEVFYFGPPAGDHRFAPPHMPVWIDFAEEIYGLPDLEGKGFKVAPDAHGPPIDPDTVERVVRPDTLAHVRDFLARRFPGLKEAPLVASEVCQYENSSNGDFLIDRHPDFDNVWLAGGGSGHGFKHGPAVGEYLAERVRTGAPVDERFSLRTKEKVQKRTVY